MTNIIDVVSSFGNSHLMLKPQNKLAVVACHHNTSKFLYPPVDKPEVRQQDGQYEKFWLIEKCIKLGLADVVKSAPMLTENSETMLAGCLAMILCYIIRVRIKNYYKNMKKYILNYPDQKIATARRESQRSHSCCDWKWRLSSSVHDLYERFLHCSEGKSCHRHLCAWQHANFAATRLWHHWRSVHQNNANRGSASISALDFSPRPRDQI